MNGNKFSRADLHMSDVEAIDFGLAVLSPRWTSEILVGLSGGARRTTHLLRDLPGISAKTLCQRLRRLCELRLVKRTTFPEVPPRVEYNLTAKGEELTSVLTALKVLGTELLVIQKETGFKRSLKDKIEEKQTSVPSVPSESCLDHEQEHDHEQEKVHEHEQEHAQAPVHNTEHELPVQFSTF